MRPSAPSALRSLIALTMVASAANLSAIAQESASTSATEVAPAAVESGFTSLFDGETLEGWKKSAENPDSWQVQDGNLVCVGDRCHLFYVGDLAPFDDFALQAHDPKSKVYFRNLRVKKLDE